MMCAQTTSLVFRRTPAARRFRTKLAYANVNLNSIVVGLEAVANSTAQKPADLAITWKPRDPQFAAREARHFAIQNLLVYATDGLDHYMSDIATKPSLVTREPHRSYLLREQQLEPPKVSPVTAAAFEQLIEELRQDTSQLDLNKSRLTAFVTDHVGRRRVPPLPVRLAKFAELSPSLPKHYVACLRLLISWRNRHVHDAVDDWVGLQVESSITAERAYFREQHSGLDVDRTLEHYHAADGAPTLKDISSLVSVLQRAIGIFDADQIDRADLDFHAVELLRAHFLEHDPDAVLLKRLWGDSPGRRRTKLAAKLAPHGFISPLSGAKHKSYAGRTLTESFWPTIVELDRRSAQRLLIEGDPPNPFR
jgi:hypothetical protein